MAGDEPVLQYQKLAEPLFTEGEVVLPDKWLPSYPSVYDETPALVEGGHTAPPFNELVTADKWAPTYPALPDVEPAAGQSPDYFAPVTTPAAAETITLDKWHGEQPVPAEEFDHAAFQQPGGFLVEPSLFVVPPYEWNREQALLPATEELPPQGLLAAPVFVPPPPPPPPVPDFAGTTPTYAPEPETMPPGSYYAEPLGPQGEPPPPVPPPIPGAGFQNKPLVERAADPPTEAQRVRRHTEKVAEIVNSLGGQDLLFYRGRNQWGIRPTGFEDVRAPSANDDVRIGAFRGATWVDRSTGRIWFCVDADEGAAVWNGPY